MDRLELKPRAKLTVNFEGVDYPVKRPPLGALADFEDALEQLKKSKKGGIRLMIGFVESCGFPKSVSVKLDADELEQIIGLVTGLKKN